MARLLLKARQGRKAMKTQIESTCCYCGVGDGVLTDTEDGRRRTRRDARSCAGRPAGQAKMRNFLRRLRARTQADDRRRYAAGRL